jgi:hypothetical protein
MGYLENLRFFPVALVGEISSKRGQSHGQKYDISAKNDGTGDVLWKKPVA